MEQIKLASLLTGKTILKTTKSDSLFMLIFTDGTFCIITDTGFDVDIDEEDFNLIPSIYNYQKLYQMELIDKETHNTFKHEEEIRIKERELQLLKKLQEKYKNN